MGGTGVLPFCSDPHKFQLIISKRNPSLLPTSADGRDANGIHDRKKRANELARDGLFTSILRL